MKFFLILLPIIALLIFSTPLTFAADTGSTKGGFGQVNINIGQKQGDGVIPGIKAVGNPNASVGNIVANALQIIAIFGGLAVLFFFVWGAFDWITSGGDKEKVSTARKKITNSLIGLALLALATFIVTLFGDIVGINPFKMGEIPTLGQQPVPRKP